VPNHSTRSFVPEVDCVSGVGWDRVPKGAERFHEIRRVVSNLAVMDFETPDHSMRLRSVHPGVTVDEVVAATGFELDVPSDVPETRLPTEDELRFIREVIDPQGLRNAEVKE
jgi:acyl CoA:acetate/3-ketoacid CoA transferase beta subunit